MADLSEQVAKTYRGKPSTFASTEHRLIDCEEDRTLRALVGDAAGGGLSPPHGEPAV